MRELYGEAMPIAINLDGLARASRAAIPLLR
jgi:hypothetical protein